MAQIDTGLGWSAKDEWLTQLDSITIASLSRLSSIDFPLGNLPVLETPQDIRDRGWYVGEIQRGSSGNIYEKMYIAGSVPGMLAAVVPQFPTTFPYNYNLNVFIRALAPINTAKLRYILFSGSDPGRVYEVNISSLVPGTSYYAGSGGPTLSRPIQNITVGNVPQFSNAASMQANVILTSETFTKVNSGYAVACVAKWKTPNGTALESPILISSISDYVDMETNVTGVNLAKLNVLYQGRKFYMSFYDRPYNGALTTTFPIIDGVSEDAPSFTLEQLFKYIAQNSNANILVLDAPDPYQEGEGSGEGGTDGEDDEEDNVDFTDPPSTSIGATGLLTIFCPNLYQLQSLGNYMWSTFDLDNWRKIIANPMDAILGLHTLPIPALITGTKAVKVAGIDTTIDMSYTTVRYIRRSMGTCEIPKKWGAYLDYNPYTKISIFLPFIGFKELDADDIMGKTIALQYMIDILTGACVAELKCGDTVLYTWSGNCANEVPISGSDWRGAIASAIGIAATVAGTALVTGGATAPMAASMVASVGANSMNLKPTINRSGAISGSAGYMGQKRPYIIRSIPNLVIPADQNKFIGYPSFVTTSLGSLTGYNEIASIHLEGIPATGNELAEIETLLKGGVIL